MEIPSARRIEHRVFFPLYAGLICILFSNATIAAMAESSAIVSWSAAYPAGNAVYQSYKVGEDLTNPSQTSEFTSQPPTDLAPQSLSLLTPTTNASVFANASTLTVQSSSSNGDAGAEALMSAFFLFSGAGTLSISIPYTLSTLVSDNTGNTTVGILASLETFDEFNFSTGITEPTPVVLFDGGLGAPNNTTGSLSLQIPFNEATDFYGILNVSVFSESSVTPVETVPIPGGVVLAIPALLPLFASRKKLKASGLASNVV